MSSRQPTPECSAGDVVYYEAVANRWGELTELEYWLAIGCIAALLEATRRAIGWAIVILALVFLLYALAGPYLPGMLAHRGYSVERVLSQLYLGGGGIFGTPLGVSATFVIVIIIYGAFLEKSGAGRVLMDIATGATGRSRGGPAKAQHPAHEAQRLPAARRRRGGGGRVHRRPAHAAGDGRRRVHHGRHDRAALSRHRTRRNHPRGAVLRGAVRRRSPGSGQARDTGARPLGAARRDEHRAKRRSPPALAAGVRVPAADRLLGHVRRILGGGGGDRGELPAPEFHAVAASVRRGAGCQRGRRHSGGGRVRHRRNHHRRHLADRPRAEVQHPGGDRFRGEPARGPGADDDRLSDPRHGPADRGGVHRTPRCGTGASPCLRSSSSAHSIR